MCRTEVGGGSDKLGQPALQTTVYSTAHGVLIRAQTFVLSLLIKIATVYFSESLVGRLSFVVMRIRIRSSFIKEENRIVILD